MKKTWCFRMTFMRHGHYIVTDVTKNCSFKENVLKLLLKITIHVNALLTIVNRPWVTNMWNYSLLFFFKTSLQKLVGAWLIWSICMKAWSHVNPWYTCEENVSQVHYGKLAPICIYMATYSPTKVNGNSLAALHISLDSFW